MNKTKLALIGLVLGFPLGIAVEAATRTETAPPVPQGTQVPLLDLSSYLSINQQQWNDLLDLWCNPIIGFPANPTCPPGTTANATCPMGEEEEAWQDCITAAYVLACWDLGTILSVPDGVEPPPHDTQVNQILLAYVICWGAATTDAEKYACNRQALDDINALMTATTQLITARKDELDDDLRDCDDTYQNAYLAKCCVSDNAPAVTLSSYRPDRNRAEYSPLGRTGATTPFAGHTAASLSLRSR